MCWGVVPTAESYLLQIQKYEVPPAGTATTAAASGAAGGEAASSSPATSGAGTPSATPGTPSTPVRAPGAAAIVRTPGQPATGTPVAVGRGTNFVRVRAPIGAPGQTIRVLGPGGQTQILRPAGAQAGNMSGIQALAAAAAQTQRLPTPTSAAAGVRMVQPTVLTTVSGGVAGVTGTQTVRLSSGATILKSGTTLQGLQTIQTAGGKQIILQKAGGVAGGAAGQTQIVTLVKTSQGMTVATVPKGMSLVQAKPGTATTTTTTQVYAKLLKAVLCVSFGAF